MYTYYVGYYNYLYTIKWNAWAKVHVFAKAELIILSHWSLEMQSNIFKCKVGDIYNIFCENCSQLKLLTGLMDETSKLVKVMAWCLQTTKHYIDQC